MQGVRDFLFQKECTRGFKWSAWHVFRRDIAKGGNPSQICSGGGAVCYSGGRLWSYGYASIDRR